MMLTLSDRRRVELGDTRTHLHWKITRNYHTGEWYLQRAGRTRYGTSYDAPLPEHHFATRREAVAAKHKLDHQHG